MARTLPKNVSNGHMQAFVKELEANQCVTRFVKKPIRLSKLIEIVADTIDKIEIVSQNG